MNSPLNNTGFVYLCDRCNVLISKFLFKFPENESSIHPIRAAPVRPPGPPATPAPASQPRHRPSVKFNRKENSGTPQIGNLKKQIDEKIYFRQPALLSPSPQNMNFLSTPEGGQARVVRQSYAGFF